MHANSLIYKQNQWLSGKMKQHERGNMKHHTEAERAEFEAWINGQQHAIPGWIAYDTSKDNDGDYLDEVVAVAWLSWYAARRAPAAPVPLHKPTPDQVAEYVGYHASRWNRVDPDDLINAILMLAAAPQPQVAAQSISAEFEGIKKAAAPVEFPIPAAICTEVRTEFIQDFVRKEYGLQAVFGSKIEFNENLYTETQVRELLAAHGIGKEKS